LTVLEEHDVDPLLHHRLDLLDHFIRVVSDAEIDADSLAMLIELLV
jgi:hypothetical protein